MDDKTMGVVEAIGSDEAPTNEDLSSAREDLVGALKVATAEDTRDLEAAVDIRAAIDSIDGELKARVEAAEAENAEAKRLLEGLEADEDEGDEDEDEEDEDAEVSDKEKEPVAASGNLRNSLGRTRARMTDTEPEGPAHAKILTLGAAQGENLKNTATLSDVATVFDRSAARVKSRGDKQSLVRVEYDFPENRRLFGSERTDNDRLLDTVVGEGAVAAAGGICAPLPADFAHPAIGNRERPIRDTLPRFQANRGGVRFSPTATIADMAGSVGVWTHATDTSPGDNEKNVLVLECEDEDVAYVDAITASLQIGNFSARFNPEFWRSRLDLLMVAHDRLAEQTLHADLVANSTGVTYGAGNGSIYSILSAVDKGVAGLRSRLRYRGQIRFVAPDWVRQALRADIASQRLGSSPAEALTVADTVINQFFSARGVTPTWSLDIDVFGAQTAGALLDFPGSDAQFLLFPEGSHFFLDGGTLDLGTEIVDSTLIKTNDRMAFLETFEKGVFRGGQSLAVTVPVDEVCVCPDVLEVEAA